MLDNLYLLIVVAVVQPLVVFLILSQILPRNSRDPSILVITRSPLSRDWNSRFGNGDLLRCDENALCTWLIEF